MFRLPYIDPQPFAVIHRLQDQPRDVRPNFCPVDDGRRLVHSTSQKSEATSTTELALQQQVASIADEGLATFIGDSAITCPATVELLRSMASEVVAMSAARDATENRRDAQLALSRSTQARLTVRRRG